MASKHSAQQSPFSTLQTVFLGVLCCGASLACAWAMQPKPVPSTVEVYQKCLADQGYQELCDEIFDFARDEMVMRGRIQRHHARLMEELLSDCIRAKKRQGALEYTSTCASIVQGIVVRYQG